MKDDYLNPDEREMLERASIPTRVEWKDSVGDQNSLTIIVLLDRLTELRAAHDKCQADLDDYRFDDPCVRFW